MRLVLLLVENQRALLLFLLREDTARSWPFVNQEAGCHHKPNLVAP